MCLRRQWVIVSFVLMLPALVNAQPNKPFLKISGEVKNELRLYAEDLEKMNRLEIKMKDGKGTEHNYSGVPMQLILEKAGVTLGNELRGEHLTKYLLVKCADGYEILFSLAELDSGFTDRQIIIADKIDGNPLPKNKGPYRLVVPGEKRQARSSFQITEFIVKFAKE